MSAPTRVARTTSRPPALTVAPVTSVAGADLDRHRFAGEQHTSTAERALLDDAVGRDLLAGAHDEAVADLQLVDRDAPLGAVASSTATSLAPSSSSARSAAPARRLARASK